MTPTPATVLVVGMILVAGGAHADDIDPTTRVRSENATIARLITQATERSATFRREVEAINRTDGLVYVHDAQCGPGVQGCLMHSVELAGPYRLLRVKLDLRRTEREMMATLGHELQHALEVLNAGPRVRSNVGIRNFYQQLAPTGNKRFETDAALQAGFDVSDELRSNAKHHTGGPKKTNTAPQFFRPLERPQEERGNMPAAR